PAARLVQCAGSNCTLPVGPCCLTLGGVCPDCAAETRRAAARDAREQAERRATFAAILLSGAVIGGHRLPSIGEAVRVQP
ncbi:MAG: hypothetical protein ABI629_21070, partial [bacterium]